MAMKTALLPIVGGHNPSLSVRADSEISINWMPQRITREQDSQDQIGGALFPSPGTKLFRSSGISGSIRPGALFESKDLIYSVIEDNVIRFNLDNTVTSMGTINNKNTPINLAGNGTDILVVNGTNTGYYITESTGVLNTISDPDFPGAASCAQMDGYFFVAKNDNSQQVWVNDNLLANSWNPLSFGTESTDPDPVKRVLADNKSVYVFGTYTTARWYNSGASPMPFVQDSGTFLNYGTPAAFSVASGDNNIFGIFQSRTSAPTIAMFSRGIIQYIATPEISRIVNRLSTVEDAIGTVYTQFGISYYQITFPTDKLTLVYDTTNKAWHVRRSGQDLNTGRHLANAFLNYKNKIIVGHYLDGNLYELSQDHVDEDGEAIIRQRITATARTYFNYLFMHELEIIADAGHGLNGTGATGTNYDPAITLYVSRDGGYTFESAGIRSLGKIGEYKKRAVWRQLGRAKDWVFKIVCSNNIAPVLLAGKIRFTEGVK